MTLSFAQWNLFYSVLEFSIIYRSSLLERMPVLDESTYVRKKVGSSDATLSSDKTSQRVSSGMPVNIPNGVAKQQAAPLVDLLDLSSDDVPVASSSATDFLNDLLGVDLPSQSSSGFLFFDILLLINDFNFY